MLTVLIGPPGAGKSTWAEAQGGLHLSTDAIREERFGRRDAHDHDDEVAAQFDDCVLAAIRDQTTDVIVENGANHRRGTYLAAARAAGVRAEVRLFENYDEALAQATARADSPLTPSRWTELADAARGAAAAVASEGWDAVHRVR